MKVPTPADVGLKVPVVLLIMPVPDHVPPAVAADNVTEAAFAQKGPAGAMVALGGAATVMVIFLVSVQLPDVME